MRGLPRSISALFSAYWRDQSGATAIVMVLATSLVLIPMAGMVIDFGDAFVVQRQLQASTDAAAIAGAYNIPQGTAVATANSFSSISGGKNLVKNASATVTAVTGYPLLKNLTSTGVTCITAGSQACSNAIQVYQQAVVPTYFLRMVGINSLTVKAKATAGLRGGKGQALDIDIVLDTTASMSSSQDNSCHITGNSNPYRIDCAKAGALALLTGLNATLDQVGLMVFPGVTTATVANDYDCSASTHPTVQAYNASPNYTISGLVTNYQTSGAINTSSNIVLAVGGGAAGCTAGLTAVGGVGTYYADVITAAQHHLTTNGRANAQKVIVFLSDGDATAATGGGVNECSLGVAAAQTAAAAGTWVYSVAYGAQLSGCSTDTGSHAISPCEAMRQIASSAATFFSDGQGVSGGCQATNSSNNISDLVSLFSSISQSLQAPRMLPDDTT